MENLGRGPRESCRYPIRILRDVEHEAMIELDFTEAAFATLASEYHSRKQLAEQQVVEWKWASWRVFYQKPLELERGGYAPGRMLKQKPSETNNCVEYGFDHERRILVERRYTEGVGFYEIFLKWSETLIESAVYDCAPDKKPINIEFVELVEGKAVRSISSAVNGCSIERYIWTGLQLTTVHQDTKERVNSETPELLPNYIAKCEYDDAGVLQRITRSFYDRTDASQIVSVTTPFERIGKRIRRKMYG